MKVIVNADDFGLTKGVNAGIIDAHKNGIVTRTTLMMNGHALDDALRLAKETPSLKVGIHLTLTFGHPLNKSSATELIDDNGKFKYTSIETSLTPKEVAQVKNEWHAQIDAFLDTGLTLDHIDSHHHVHGWEDLKDVVRELSAHYNVPVRCVDTLKDTPECLLTESLWLNFYKEGVKESLLKELTSLPYRSVEVMVHPAIVDDELRRLSSYSDLREEETRLLKSIDLVDGIQLC